ncbi:unnamed protein product [Cyprideis torosa]|uniref:Battenin n=1 Tax=Cyprideis torosa TaxID=163714 RepID=A0A7R8WEE1_9CRUS|nr:unnamed protein product [Cyprideis torosa]CAG0894246.1 unnamed protein product [Cyprideis torosa]
MSGITPPTASSLGGASVGHGQSEQFEMSQLPRSGDGIATNTPLPSEDASPPPQYPFHETDSSPTVDALQQAPPRLSVPHRFRNLVAFWLLGLCNNFAYVVMLSAAHDILYRLEQGHLVVEPSKVTKVPGRDCNPTSTGAILLADVLPGILVKVVAPFFFLRINIHLRILLAVLFLMGSLTLVAIAKTPLVAYIGVSFAAVGGSLGELSLLAFSSRFQAGVISGWASGTGASGVAGSFSYAVLISLGLRPTDTLMVMLIVPVTMASVFWLLLRIPPSPHPFSEDAPPFSSQVADPLLPPSPARRPSLRSSAMLPLSEESLDTLTVSLIDSPASGVAAMHRGPLTLAQKIRLLPRIFPFMAPICLVYFAEYVINQGLFELIYFERGLKLDHQAQYRWMNAAYQIGVFVSRSSAGVVRVRRVWILALLQLVNLVFFTAEACLLFLPSFILVLILVVYEGLLGGAAYVNTFLRIHEEVEPLSKKEFFLATTSLADAVGIGLAGMVALPIHDAICRLPGPTRG